MATGFGTNVIFGFGEESTYGTPVASSKYLEIMEEAVKGEQSWISKPTLRSPSQNQRVQSKKSVAGNIKMNMGYEGFERLLKHALGANATSGAGPYTHTLTLATALPTGLTLHISRDAAAVGVGSAFEYDGCQITKMTLTQSIEDLLMVDFEFIGQDFRNVNIDTPTYPTFYQIDWSQFSLTWNASAISVRSFEVSLDNTLADDRFVLGSRTRVGLGRSGPRKVTGKFEMEFDSLTMYAAFRDQSTTAALQATWVNGLSGSNAKALTVVIPKALLQAGEPSVSDAGPIVVTYEFEGFQDAAANDEIGIGVVNSLATI